MEIEGHWKLSLATGAVSVCLCESSISITICGEKKEITLHLDAVSTGQFAEILRLAGQSWGDAARGALESTNE